VSYRKLTEDQVIAMRHRYRAGDVTFASLAEDYGLSRGTVAAVLYGESYGSVGDSADFIPRSLRGQSKTKCQRGHPFTETNTGWHKRPNGTYARQCRACRRLREG
jgi:hypothetical protein